MGGSVRHFGSLADGRAVQAIDLRAGDLRGTILTWGGVLQDLRLAGVAHGLTPGSATIADYQGQMRYHGALIGPVVNRLSGAKARIAGRDHAFEANQDGRHCLHGGLAGTHLKLWELGAADDASVSLSLHLPDGEGGFPGNRVVTARFGITPPATLRMEVTGTTDAPTLMNFANHSYWNLDGAADWSGHLLRVAADHYLPTTPDFTPTGTITPVDGGALDFRDGRVISPGRPDLDNCFCLSATRQPLRDVLWMTGRSGVTMTVATTETGIQLYDGRAAIRPGHGTYEGIAVEAQGWPDAPNHAGFPSIELGADHTYRQVTEWRFDRR
jgi:aldose 1-epimerase